MYIHEDCSLFQIVEIKGEAVLKLNLTIYNDATEGAGYSDMSCVDTSVDVQLGCIRGVFLMRFVNDLLVGISCRYLMSVSHVTNEIWNKQKSTKSLVIRNLMLPTRYGTNKKIQNP